MPFTQPAVPTDRLLHALEALGPMQIQLCMAYANRLDVNRLAVACERLLDAEPLVGCRFVPRGGKAEWESLPTVSRQIFHQATDEQSFLTKRLDILDPLQGPQSRVWFFRGTMHDHLLLQVRHELADAGGVKQLAKRLAAIYRRLRHEPDYRPAPNHADRHHRLLWREIGLGRRLALTPKAIARAVGLYRAGPGRSSVCLGEVAGQYRLAVRHLDTRTVDQVRQLGDRLHATLNDSLIAAFIRAYGRLHPDQAVLPQRLETTVDLRRYLPGQESRAVTNLSGFEHYLFDDDPGQSFSDLLRRVVAETRRRKRQGLGLDDYLFSIPAAARLAEPRRHLERALRKALATGRLAQGLTNMGPIPPEAVDFDGPAEQAHLLVPPARAPYLVVGASGYAGTLTLSCGYQQFADGLDASAFLDAMVAVMVAAA